MRSSRNEAKQSDGRERLVKDVNVRLYRYRLKLNQICRCASKEMEVKKVKSRQRHSNHKQVNETMRKREGKKKVGSQHSAGSSGAYMIPSLKKRCRKSPRPVLRAPSHVDD